MEVVEFSITTDASGAYNGTVDTRAPKKLYAVEWVGSSLGTAVDAVLSVVDAYGGADVTLLTLTNVQSNGFYYPRAAVHDGTGSALASYVPHIIAGSLKLAVTSGGSVLPGTCNCYLERERF